MPRALLSSKKMQSQVIGGISIMQCRIIISRAEKLRVLSFFFMPGHIGSELTNSCRAVSSAYSRVALG